MNTATEKLFLVFSGGNDRAVLGFLRALRSCGERACIVARTHNDIVLRTTFRRDVHCIRDSHVLNMDIFTKCINHVRKYSGDRALVVLPSSEYFNEFLLQYRDKIEELGCEIPLIDKFLYTLLTSKRSATELFGSAGFSIPKEYIAPTPLKPPVVAKPLHNVSRDGRSLYPQLMETHSQLNTFYSEHRSNDYFFQEYVRGKSVYLLLYISRHGKCELSWSQRNLLQQPNGKSMLLAMASDFHHSPLAVQMISLLRKRGFWGLGMIELIQTPDRHVFIEMNPRIWGPIQFCLDQNQPLVSAFIGEALYNDPLRFTGRSSGKKARGKSYFWLGGLLDTLASGKQPVWHTTKSSIPVVIFKALNDDIYFRMDSWRCFFRELTQALKLALNRERTER